MLAVTPIRKVKNFSAGPRIFTANLMIVDIVQALAAIFENLTLSNPGFDALMVGMGRKCKLFFRNFDGILRDIGVTKHSFGRRS